MKKQLRQFQRRDLTDETASTLVLVTAFMVGLFGFAALTIDVGRAYKEKRHEQYGTDAGAYAAVNMLNTNLAANTAANNAIQEATDVASANGVTATELSNTGTVEVGRWANGQFFANQTTNGVYTAVRVPAKRNVGMMFAKVVGMSSMSPAVHSIADLESAGRVANVIPFGISVDQVTNHTYGDTLVLNDATIASGKQGKIDLKGYQNTPAWQADMNTSGCNCEVSVGNISAITGNAQVSQSFIALGVGAIVIMPVSDQSGFTGNSGLANIIGFVVVKLTNIQGGNGNNWSDTIQFLATVVGTGGGGTCPPPCAQTRLIVQ